MTTAVGDTKPFSAFEWMLASRYLRARRKEGFISVIAGFSFLGIMLGVATLIIVMAVMNGTVFEDCTMGATSDMRTLLYRSLSPEKMAGVVGMANCRFVRCRFVQVGFTGGEELLDELQTKVRQAPAGDAAQ